MAINDFAYGACIERARAGVDVDINFDHLVEWWFCLWVVGTVDIGTTFSVHVFTFAFPLGCFSF
jgi:hypothetical protein